MYTMLQVVLNATTGIHLTLHMYVMAVNEPLYLHVTHVMVVAHKLYMNTHP
jgi:hypothetical protein